MSLPYSELESASSLDVCTDGEHKPSKGPPKPKSLSQIDMAYSLPEVLLHSVLVPREPASKVRSSS